MAIQSPRLLRLPNVMTVTGLRRSTIYALEKQNKFPSRVAIGVRAVAWREDEITAWIEARQRKVA